MGQLEFLELNVSKDTLTMLDRMIKEIKNSNPEIYIVHGVDMDIDNFWLRSRLVSELIKQEYLLVLKEKIDKGEEIDW